MIFQAEILLLIASILIYLGLSFNLLSYHQDTKEGKKRYWAIKEKLLSNKKKLAAKNLSKCMACKAYNKAATLDKMSNIKTTNNPIAQNCPYRLSCTQITHKA